MVMELTICLIDEQFSSRHASDHIVTWSNYLHFNQNIRRLLIIITTQNLKCERKVVFENMYPITHAMMMQRTCYWTIYQIKSILIVFLYQLVQSADTLGLELHYHHYIDNNITVAIVMRLFEAFLLMIECWYLQSSLSVLYFMLA